MRNRQSKTKNRQIDLVRKLRNGDLKQAIDNYCNGITLARVIVGECLNADAINEFRKLYIEPHHTTKRIKSNIIAKAEELKKPVVMIAPVKYPQTFEDDICIPPARTRIS